MDNRQCSMDKWPHLYWRFWLLGMDFKGQHRIRPFRKLETAMIPNKDIKNQFNNEWRPIMRKMENTPGLEIPADINEITSAFVDLSYHQATEHLKANICSFIWSKGLKHETWTVGTWSTKTLPNQIRKYGSDRDKSNLPAPKHQNRPHQRKRTLIRKDTQRTIRRRHPN